MNRRHFVMSSAMAAGTPVVASDISGYRDVARQEKEAVLVPGGDPAALAGGLRRVLDDATLAARLVEAGTARAASFSMRSTGSVSIACFTAATRPP